MVRLSIILNKLNKRNLFPEHLCDWTWFVVCCHPLIQAVFQVFIYIQFLCEETEFKTKFTVIYLKFDKGVPRMSVFVCLEDHFS